MLKQNLGDEIIQGLQQLVQVPERFEHMIGYFQSADIIPTEVPRFVCFYWDCEAGDVRFDDGENDEECDWEFWDFFLTHPRIAERLQELRLGLDGTAAGHGLILDRTTRWLYAIPRSEKLKTRFSVFASRVAEVAREKGFEADWGRNADNPMTYYVEVWGVDVNRFAELEAEALRRMIP